MKLHLNPPVLEIHLTKIERLLTFHPAKTMIIPLSAIEGVSTAKPPWSWRTLRALGTSIPWVINAGTFHTPKGWEFWWMTRSQHYLVIDLREGDYTRILLTIENNQYWQDILTPAIAP